MRSSLEDAMNKAFEESTMKNVPIDQFWSFKRRNGAQNWNLRKKLSKIGPIRNFDFQSKVNVKSQSQLVKGPSQWIIVRVGSRVEQQSRWHHPMTCRWRGLGLTWKCLRGYWRGVMTSSYDVRWHQQQYRRVARACNVHRRMEEKPETQVARGGACNIVWPPDSQAK